MSEKNKISKNIKIELENFDTELANLMKTIDRLSKINTENVEPMFRTIESDFKIEDKGDFKISEKNPNLEGNVIDNYFLTPKVINKNE